MKIFGKTAEKKTVLLYSPQVQEPTGNYIIETNYFDVAKCYPEDTNIYPHKDLVFHFDLIT